jgi:predicted Zn-dependent peptidase
VGAFVVAVALGAPAGAAPAVGAPAAVADAGGGARAVTSPDPGALVAGVEIAVRAGIDRETGTQNGLAALVAECVLRTPVAGSATALLDAVDARGASVRYAVGVRSVRFYLEGTPAGVAASAPLVAAAVAAPSFDAATLAAARDALAERNRDLESDARIVGRAMLRAAFYRGAAAMPPYGTAASLAVLGAADARAFHAAWYRRGGAVAVAAGRTGPETDAASAALLGALADGGTAATPIATKPFGAQPRRLVTQRDVGAPYVVLGFAAPALGDRDFAAALVLRALLRGVLEGPSAETVPAALRAAGATYAYDAAPAQLTFWINGARGDAAVGLAAVDAVAKAAAAKPLTPTVLQRYRTLARGEWLLENVSVDERATAIAGAVVQGLSPDVGDVVADAIGRVTGADVQRVAKAYFQKFDVALVLPRGSGR